MTHSATLPPGPRGAPLVGSALDLRRDVLGTYERARRAYGDVVRVGVGPPGLRATLYAVFHPDAVRRVLAGEADGYRKDNRFYEELRWALGDGLLNSQDERWLRQPPVHPAAFHSPADRGLRAVDGRRGHRPRGSLAALGRRWEAGRPALGDVASDPAGRRAAPLRLRCRARRPRRGRGLSDPRRIRSGPRVRAGTPPARLAHPVQPAGPSGSARRLRSVRRADRAAPRGAG